jgi:hypothetical protein
LELEMFKICLFSLALFALAAPGSAAERFSGQGGLAPNQSQTSADQRFVLDAAAFPPGTDFTEKKPNRPSHLASSAPKALEQRGGRFGLTAQLSNPVSPNVACTGGPVLDPIFSNGFE